jgi:hypothetical protein
MLTLSKKLCPFISFLLMMGCGKKITESGSKSKPLVQYQEPSPTLILAIEQRVVTFVPDRSGQYLLPDRLRVRSANATDKTVTIVYNIRADDPETYDAKCIYKGTAPDTMPVQKCVDQDGVDLGNITNGATIMLIDAGNTIKFTSSSEELKADAIFDVTWM